MFTDASGEDRCISADVLIDNVWKYTWTEVPQHIWDSLIPREDEQIGVTEAMAVALALETFKEDLTGNMAWFFIDNAGALAGFIKGGSRSIEQNIVIGEAWMFLAGQRVAPEFWRVASKCNCADGPSRRDFDPMHKIGAFCSPADSVIYL